MCKGPMACRHLRLLVTGMEMGQGPGHTTHVNSFCNSRVREKPCTEQSQRYEGLRVHVFKKFSLTAASEFDGGMCGVGWVVPAKPTEDS